MDMAIKQSFSKRNRYSGGAKEITIREGAPENLRPPGPSRRFPGRCARRAGNRRRALTGRYPAARSGAAVSVRPTVRSEQCMLHSPILVAGISRGVGRWVANRIGRCAMVSFQGRLRIELAAARWCLSKDDIPSAEPQVEKNGRRRTGCHLISCYRRWAALEM